MRGERIVSAGSVKLIFARTTMWAAVSFALNLVWEVLQLPLYTIGRTGTLPQLAFAVLHCTAGDALIAGTSFLVAGTALRTANWPATRPLAGGLTALAFGIAYTSYSEWHNVYETGAWAYTPDMPLVFGIGLAPLLQWLVLPVVTLLIVRARTRAHADTKPGAA